MSRYNGSVLTTVLNRSLSITRSSRRRPPRLRVRCVTWAVPLLVAAVLPAGAFAQPLPQGPITTAGGRLTIGGEASASIAPDDSLYVNYSDDAYSVLRLARIDASAILRLGPHVSLLGDLRVQGSLVEGGWQVKPHALFLRVRPWADRSLDVQAGLIPPVFGAFSRHAYGTDNPLIGLPLSYQYLTSLRYDAVPGSTDNLLTKQGRGWLVRYPIGNADAESGVPLVDGLHYPMGVEVHGGNQVIEASAAVTSGSPSDPRASDLAGGPNVSGRVAVTPAVGLVLGVSAARSGFLSQAVTTMLSSSGASTTAHQMAAGFDVEYSRGHWLVRSEAIVSRWDVPLPSATPLRAVGVDVEGRYRILPGLYAAARVDRLDFSDVQGSAGWLPWEAPVRRVEVGGGFSIARNVVLKAGYQYNWRNTALRATLGLASTQLLVWF
jgi:hypothetical protein